MGRRRPGDELYTVVVFPAMTTYTLFRVLRYRSSARPHWAMVATHEHLIGMLCVVQGSDTWSINFAINFFIVTVGYVDFKFTAVTCAPAVHTVFILVSATNTAGYGEDEDSEYDQALEGIPGGCGGGSTNGSKQAKNRIVLNPTEGFHHSDVYFEPPPEEANVVERILSMRTRVPITEDERKKHGDSVEEFFVKYKNYSYLHAEWCSFDKLLVGDKRFDGKAKRYKVKQATVIANVDDELFNPEYTMADRVIDVATQVFGCVCGGGEGGGVYSVQCIFYVKIS